MTTMGSGLTATVKDLVAVALELSVTLTVNVALPGVVGVPAIVPPALNASPSGSDPETMDQLYPPVPPLAESGCEYGMPAVALGSEVVVTIRAAGLMVRVSALVAVVLELSDTWAVNFAVPKAVGVPVMAPAVLRVSP